MSKLMRTALAKRFFLSQRVAPKNRSAFGTTLRAYAKETKEPILRSDELIAALADMPEAYAEKWKKLCRKRSVRSQSGVAVIALLTRNFGCPGKCVYCPTSKGMPKSYLPTEPAVLRAITAKFSPAAQIRARLMALKATGHDTSKIELIIMGGTWSALPRTYQSQYIRSCYHALNGESDSVNSLDDEKRMNETAQHRCVGLTLETRPDWITPEEIRTMRRYGCTRVEIGVQTLDDRIQKLTRRGHGTAEVAKATQLLRDSGLKVVYHMMLNLPGSNPAKDVTMFKTLFSDPRFCPDQIKIYPCVLTEDSELIEWHKDGRWKPYSDEELIETITKIKKHIPEYCRVIRVIRDIPGSDIRAGSKTSNLRQLMQNAGVTCRCIRCREIKNATAEQTTLVRREYETVGGKEIFLSYEDTSQDKLIGLLRLRIPEGSNTTLVRELHVYGEQTPVGTKGSAAQHSGIGGALLKEAEIISKKAGAASIAVISGVGVRQYYRNRGYRLEDGYMVKNADCI